METSKEIVVKQPTPYVSFSTFNHALTSIAEHGVPSQIDRSVLRQFSGANQNLIFQAFRFIGFTNEKDEPTEHLIRYAKGQPEEQKGILSEIIKKRYPDQVKILANGTSQQLKDSFKDLNVEPSVKQKCVTFFLQIAKVADLPISTHILRGSRSRSPRNGKGRTVGSKATRRSTSLPPPPLLPRDVVPPGMVSVPIAIGIGKTWTINIEENPAIEDMKRFVQMVKITLGVQE